MLNREHLLTYIYLLVYILLSSGVILYNKWVLSTKHFNFPYHITLTMIYMGFSGVVAFFLIRVFKTGFLFIALSTVLFPESVITGLNIIGYAIALCGVVMYNFLKVRDARIENLPERVELKTEKASDLYDPNDNAHNISGGRNV